MPAKFSVRVLKFVTHLGLAVKPIITLALVAALLLGCTAAPSVNTVDPQPKNVIFTTGLTTDSEPINDVKQISIKDPRIFLYVRWQLPRSEHIQVTRIIDGAGRVVAQREDRFVAPATSPTPSTWIWYDIDKSRDTPGAWTFEVYLNGRKMVEERLTVTT